MRLFDRPIVVCGIYLALTLVMTWPVVTGLTTNLPNDLGDPMFVSGMLTWASKHWLELLGGDLSAWRRFWNAPFFYPETLATAFSEHFTLHALLTLPVYVVTRNIVLCYNLLWLAAFVLSGLGMYLFVRELTGRPLAAFVAGLAFAFAPYRFATTPHLQVISSHWMPFALYGFRRYFMTGRRKPLAGGALALWAQHLSSGYYMVYFGPFVAIYVLAEIATRRLWLKISVWLHLAGAAAVALLLTVPFGLPYLQLQQRYRFRRPLSELTPFSADLYGWLTASDWMLVWGKLRTFPKAEGNLFPGVLVVILALIGLIYGWRHLRARDGEYQGAAAVALFATLAIVLSFWMSLGPIVHVSNYTTEFPSLYMLAYDYVPGYNVARVPARFAMITVFALAVAAGVALSAIERRRKWPVLICGVILLVEGSAFPLPINGAWSSDPTTYRAAPGRAIPESDQPELDRFLATLDNAIVAHLPFGLPEREIQYVYYSAMHRRRMVNGYSGAFPPSYAVRVGPMSLADVNPRNATEQMKNDAVTVLVVHTGAWIDDRGRKLASIFDNSRGFERIGQFGDAFVYRLHY
jgi:hypothetical protein